MYIFHDRRIRWAGPLIIDLYLLIFFYSKLYTSVKSVALCVVASTIYSFLAWESARFITLKGIRKIPGIRRIKERLFLLIMAGVPMTFVTTLLNQVFRLWIGFFTEMRLLDFIFIEGLNLIITTVIISIYERQYYLEQWNQLHTEAEHFRRINLQTHYKALEDQVKPHFLFNSLNTLQSLISQDPQRAEEYVEEMSYVYRYLLRKNKGELTTVAEELSFIQSYLAMLKTRFEDSLDVQVSVDPASYDYLLPPFVLQLVLENAIKHNVLSKDRPLRVSIVSETETRISVTNNLQKKQVKEPSEKMGLINLIERYKLLKMEEQLYIAEDEHFFKVVLPLLKTNIFHTESKVMA